MSIQEDLFSYLFMRFGLEKELFSGFQLYLGSKNRIYLGPKNTIDLPKITCIGISIARADNSIKPTTNLFQIFGDKVTKNFIDLNREQTIDYIKGSDLNLTEVTLEDGYVLLRYEGKPLGCGLLKQKILKNMLPKAKRMKLNYL